MTPEYADFLGDPSPEALRQRIAYLTAENGNIRANMGETDEAALQSEVARLEAENEELRSRDASA